MSLRRTGALAPASGLLPDSPPVGAPPRPITGADIGAAVPNLALGAVSLAMWIAPLAVREKMVSTLMLVMLLEYIIVHSSAFMGGVLVSGLGRAKKSLALVGLTAFYTLFVAGFGLMFRTLQPVWSFWGLTANRLIGVVLGQAPEGEERDFVRHNWVVSVAFYLLFVTLTCILPIPALGISAEVVRRQGFTASGLWIEQPQRVIAFGFLYFTAVGLSELRGHAWLRKRARRGRRA